MLMSTHHLMILSPGFSKRLAINFTDGHVFTFIYKHQTLGESYSFNWQRRLIIGGECCLQLVQVFIPDFDLLCYVIMILLSNSIFNFCLLKGLRFLFLSFYGILCIGYY